MSRPKFKKARGHFATVMVGLGRLVENAKRMLDALGLNPDRADYQKDVAQVQAVDQGHQTTGRNPRIKIYCV